MDKDHARTDVMPNTENNGKYLTRKRFVTCRPATSTPRRYVAAKAATCIDIDPNWRMTRTFGVPDLLRTI